ncbi:MAG: glycine cleavage system aminomethyltransferase GcvT [Candidatus Omnitrophica bacterium]|nr:glycine cleavage system aminomethyltransferase GcvT [Candidatus Omnitrophota bacterium]
MTTPLHRTPLYAVHVALGGKMVPFAGWEMAVQYPDGILKEHEANRKGCSIFDCSHMGEFLIEGDAVLSGLDGIVTQAIIDQPVGTCRYGMALNDRGGVIDDLIVYRLAQEKWMVVVNASNIEKDAAHFRKHLTSKSKFMDISFQTAKLDVQGPLSRDVLKAFIPGVDALEYYTFATFNVLGQDVIVSRTGYTGELGYEIYYPWAKAEKVWHAVMADKRVRPTGLGVRDVLRVEVSYPLYGHELSEDISPAEAGLKRFVDVSKDFVGRDAFLRREKEGGRKIIHFTSENRRAPRQGHILFAPDGYVIGDVVSGTFSPALGVGIGIGFLKKEFTSVGKDIIFGDEKIKVNAQAATRPFYKAGSLKN